MIGQQTCYTQHLTLRDKKESFSLFSPKFNLCLPANLEHEPHVDGFLLIRRSALILVEDLLRQGLILEPDELLKIS